MPKTLCLDIGGTKTNFSVISSTHKIIKKEVIPTPLTRITFLNTLSKNINMLAKDHQCTRIGIAIAGQVNHLTGKIIKSPNLDFINSINLKSTLQNKVSGRKTIKIENDANCAALADSIIGLKRKYKNVITLTIGTGIGCGLVIDNKIYHGSKYASEAGHMFLEVNSNKICSCGKYGHLETLASGTAIERNYFEYTNKKMSAKDIEHDALLHNNQTANHVYHQAGTYLGFGIVNLINILDPNIVSLSGGIGKSPLILERVKKFVKENIFFKEKRVLIKSSNLKKDAGVIGASLLF